MRAIVGIAAFIAIVEIPARTECAEFSAKPVHCSKCPRNEWLSWKGYAPRVLKKWLRLIDCCVLQSQSM